MARPPDAYDLDIAGPDGARTVEKLVGPAISIGRADGNTVVLRHDDVSRKHAVVEIGPQGAVLRDLSTNGTFVEQHRVPNGSMPLPVGKVIQIGPYQVRFRVAGTGAQKTISGEANVEKSRERRAEVPTPSVLAEGAVEVAGEPLVERTSPPPPPVRHKADAMQHGNAALQYPKGASQQKNPSLRQTHMAMPAVAAAGGNGAAQQARGDAVQHGNAALQHPKGEPHKPPPPGQQSASGGDLPDAEKDRLKRWMRGLLLEALDLPALRSDEILDKQLGPKVNRLIDELFDEHARKLPKGLDRARMRKELADEVLGLGPLEDLLADETVSEVMVVDRATIYVEKRGKLELTGARFSSEDALRAAIERIVTPLGRRIDESTPMVDARLKDGSRVNAIIPPLALRGPCLTIRKFSKKKLQLGDLIAYGSLDERIARFLMRAVISRKNILVSGGTGSGKTTLLNVLSSAIPDDERIVTIEDAAELKLHQPHVVGLETRPANMEGKGEFSIRDLVRNALRMRPDRIIVGECRGGEALDMLQAMNTGHDGSLTTTHANSPEEAIARIETLVLMAGIDLPTRAIREQIANSIHVVVQQARFVDGTRKITKVSEVTGIDDDGTVKLEDIFEFHRMPGVRGEVVGEYRATGYLPTFLTEFITLGLVSDGEFL